jgi:guanylate kinase
MSQKEPSASSSSITAGFTSVPDPAELLTRPHSGILFVLSGPSGVGKDAVLNSLVRRGLPLHVTVTCTTRAMRLGEKDGVSYHFVSLDRFAEMQAQGELLEWAMVHGNKYGTPAQQVRDAFARGSDVLLKIDVQGARQVKRRVPEAVLIFLAPPSMKELVSRLTQRSTESVADRETRIANAYEEMAHLSEYDYVVVNYAHRLEEAVERILAIVVAEGCRVKPRKVIV